MRVLRIAPYALVLGVAALLAACGSFPAQSARPPEACEGSLLGPVTLMLANDGRSVVAGQDGAILLRLQWPAGFGLRADGTGGGDIVDAAGRPVARVGDEVWLGGALAQDEVWAVCGPIEHEGPPEDARPRLGPG